MSTRALLLRLVAGAVVLALVAGVAWRVLRDEPLRVSAVFTDTTGLYVGNDVKVLGVPVGEVSAITPAGRTVRVEMEFPGETELPPDVQASIMQSSLVTDRFVELGPAYRSGPTLPDDTELPLSRTRSPANLDEMVRAVDELVVALGRPGPGRSDIGRLLDVSARNLDGQGRFVRDALIASQGAMDAVSGTEPDLERITANLGSLTGALADRDRLVRRLSTNVTRSTGMLADQRRTLVGLVAELADLVEVVTTFVRRNRGDLRAALGRSEQLLTLLHRRRDDLAETVDLLPVVGQNLWRAYDPLTDRVRIRIDMRNTGPLSPSMRFKVCRAFGLPDCERLTNPDGTGALDPLFEQLGEQAPDEWPLAGGGR